MLNIGDKVKLIDINLRKEIAFNEQIGFVEKIYKDFILISLDNYKTCLNKADLIEGEGFKLQVRQDNEWLDIGKEIFKNIKLLDRPKDRDAYHNFRKMSIRRG
ncbi:hypothetical protein [Clostridium perfringens]|uniref:hypothetical protein n=1 Tax=Clostridium perfringens TaxID=1502 RepID=UPI002446E62C|nr:hypothetical protein [Clostridium perfringens]MDH2474280.1 hypothetical protein [Clostridium perfringens]